MLFTNNTNILLKTVLLAVSGVVFGVAFAEGDDLPVKSANSDDRPALVINENKQKLSGIKTMKLSLTQRLAEYEAMGKVISIQPLLTLRERYLTVQAELQSTMARRKLAILNLS
jgi:hypothetical protein